MARGEALKSGSEFEKLLNVVESLRHPQTGCPWDLNQNHKSLLKCLLEEAYEFIAAVETDNTKNMEEELGDILLQVLLHCQIAEESKHFDIESVSKTLREKLIRRHPHVFGDESEKVAGPKEALEKWRKAKEEERSSPSHRINKRHLMAPSLSSAFKIGEHASRLNFDWENPLQVSYKVEEEWQECKEEIAHWPRGNKARIEEEMGDVLFSCAQLARKLDLDPEKTLKKANEKFIRRFNLVEDRLKKLNLHFEKLNLEELDQHWNAVKEEESHGDSPSS